MHHYTGQLNVLHKKIYQSSLAAELSTSVFSSSTSMVFSSMSVVPSGISMVPSSTDGHARYSTVLSVSQGSVISDR